jgi:hypothetical protein
MPPFWGWRWRWRLDLPMAFGTTLVALAMAGTVAGLSNRGWAMDTTLGVLAHSALAFGLVAYQLPARGAHRPVRLAVRRHPGGEPGRPGLHLAGVACWWRACWPGAGNALLTATLNEDLAHAAGIDPDRERLVLTLALALVVAVALKVVGALLIAAMLIIPAAAARTLARTPEAMATPPKISSCPKDCHRRGVRAFGRPAGRLSQGSGRTRRPETLDHRGTSRMRARYFTASVGAQIQIRVLASRRLKDEDIVPFFETLNVQAMNAAVVDRQPGLGEVPVLVLGSALGEADLAAYVADRAARAESAIRRAAERRDMAEAELAASADAAPAGQGKPVSTKCRTEDGVKRCTVTTGG